MSSFSFAAESSGDLPVPTATKEKLRKEIVGAATKNADREYIVGYRDIIYVEIYGEGSMAVGVEAPASSSAGEGDENTPSFLRGRGTGAEVRMDGRVSLRHIGDVYVVGMTLSQIADYLKELYSSIYENPSVTVTLVQGNSRQYTLMGQVKTPGLYHLDFPLTLVKAIAKAGGFNEWANNEVTVIRQDDHLVPHEEKKGSTDKKKDKGGQTFEFDYSDFLKGKHLEKNIIIQPGDVIVVH
ncbi:polysaccharide biosynthesis/export family protein [Desulfogranum japonicum]|uniref:polysaccharide biosynthesis/export family protein n=1 Tax=Desulfogranum japonicum TaxID=231447 RepID=UPI001377D7EB|nr:polysaccharide biosynthesis/export family protein [Desulfogranum japonicum]